jgi:hypothetical protein
MVGGHMGRPARTAGIVSATLLRWLPEFQTAYREVRRAAFGQAIARLQQGTSTAATTLIKLLVDPNTPPSVRARVADFIFNHAAKAIEISRTLSKRLERLETRMIPAGEPLFGFRCEN